MFTLTQKRKLNRMKTTSLRTKIQNITESELASIIQNDNVIVSTLSETEKFAVVLFDELSKALSKSELTMTLQCNNKKARNRENTIVTQYMLYAYSYTIQVYCKKNACSVVCSRSEVFKNCLLEQYASLEFDTTKDEAYKNAVSYDDLYRVLVSLLAVCKLASESKSKSESKSESKSKSKSV